MNNTKIQIRSAQVRALESALIMEDYEAELVDLLRASYSDAITDETDDELRQHIREGTARARTHGFAELSTCAQFVMLELSLGRTLDDAEWATPILADHDAGDARIAALFAAADPNAESP